MSRIRFGQSVLTSYVFMLKEFVTTAFLLTDSLIVHKPFVGGPFTSLHYANTPF